MQRSWHLLGSTLARNACPEVADVAAASLACATLTEWRRRAAVPQASLREFGAGVRWPSSWDDVVCASRCHGPRAGLGRDETTSRTPSLERTGRCRRRLAGVDCGGSSPLLRGLPTASRQVLPSRIRPCAFSDTRLCWPTRGTPCSATSVVRCCGGQSPGSRGGLALVPRGPRSDSGGTCAFLLTSLRARASRVCLLGTARFGSQQG